MRCKNCGFDNAEGRYICENCGSPLFDEDNEINPENDNENTKIIPNISQLEDAESVSPQGDPPHHDGNNEDDDEEKSKNKRNIIIIIVLAVILVAMTVGIIVSASLNKGKETTAAPSNSVSQTSETSTAKHSSTKLHTTTTEKETTTEQTTEKQTEKETTTKLAKYNVYIDVDGNGSVTGDGNYEKGKKVTLTATADAGYKFDGWFDNATGELVASGSKYTVNVNADVHLTAKFSVSEDVQQ